MSVTEEQPRSRKLWWPLLIAVAFLVVATEYARPPRQPPVYCDENADPAAVDILMLSASWCRYCARARDFFIEQELSYCEYDIERQQAGAARYRDSGLTGVPIIYVGRDVFVGFNSHEIRQALVAADVIGVERL